MPPNRTLPRICIALGLPDVPNLLAHARREAEAGETFLEFRLDFLDAPAAGAAAIADFLRDFPDTCILATCRRHQNHGRFNGSIEEQLAILEQAIGSGAQAIDVEIETAEACEERVSQFRSSALVVVSYHNFEATPPMDTVAGRVLGVRADVYKLVTTARKPSDNVRVLAAARGLPRQKLVVLAMGDLGFPTRVLSPVFGGCFTYAAPMAIEGTAPGQATARVLRSVYHVEKLARSAKIYGVIADPIRHSISPAVLNRAFQSRRIDAVYLPFLVTPAYLRDFFSLAVQTPRGRFQRHHSAQAEDHPVPGRGRAAGQTHRRGEHGMAQGRQVAWRQYRRSGHHASPGARTAPGQVLGAGGGKRRRGARCGLCAVRCRGQARHHRTQPRPGAGPGQDLRRRTIAARTVERPQIRCGGACHAARHVPARATNVSSTARSPAKWSSTWSTILWRRFC